MENAKASQITKRTNKDTRKKPFTNADRTVDQYEGLLFTMLGQILGLFIAINETKKLYRMVIPTLISLYNKLMPQTPDQHKLYHTWRTGTMDIALPLKGMGEISKTLTNVFDLLLINFVNGKYIIKAKKPRESRESLELDGPRESLELDGPLKPRELIDWY